MTNRTWGLSHATGTLGRHVDKVAHYWNDEAARRVSGRWLRPHQAAATQAATALGQQRQHLQQADAATTVAQECLQAAVVADEGLTRQLHDAQEEARKAVQYVQRTNEEIRASAQALQAALQTAARAGGACGETASIPQADELIDLARLHKEVDEAEARRTALDAFLELFTSEEVQESTKNLIAKIRDVPVGSLQGVDVLFDVAGVLSEFNKMGGFDLLGAARDIGYHNVREWLTQLRGESDG